MIMRLISLLASFTAILLIFIFAVRPWYLRWGATDEEIQKILPGDEIVPNAVGSETRAITIDAPIDSVWPWLAQLGQDRGGFYSFDLLENIVGCEMPTVDSLRPDKQAWKPGDRLWMYPPDKAGGVGYATLRTYIPGRALGFGTHVMGTSPDDPEDGSWSFALEPTGDSTTRLLIRGRGAPGRSLLGTAFDRSMFEPIHFMMERRMMIGVKQLAEGGDRDRLLNHIHIAIWTITFALFITSSVMVLRRREWTRPLVGFVASALIFQVQTLAQPDVIVEGAMTLALVFWLWWNRGSNRESHVTGHEPLHEV